MATRMDTAPTLKDSHKIIIVPNSAQLVLSKLERIIFDNELISEDV